MKILYENEDIHVRVWCPSTYCIGFTQENEEESETAEDGEGAGDEDSDEDESDDKDENESKFNVRTRNICAESLHSFFQFSTSLILAFLKHLNRFHCPSFFLFIEDLLMFGNITRMQILYFIAIVRG